MVNTINGKYFRVNGKTDSRKFYKDKWTLISHFPNKNSNSKSILAEWLMKNYEADFGQTLNKNFSNFWKQICETKIK